MKNILVVSQKYKSVSPQNAESSPRFSAVCVNVLRHRSEVPDTSSPGPDWFENILLTVIDRLSSKTITSP